MKAIAVISSLLLTAPLVGCAEQTAAQHVVPANYIAAQAALAEDDFAKAKSEFAALAKESSGDVQKYASAAANAADIGAMRDAFKSLSDVVIQMELPEGHAVAFCPMFKGGGSWVQKQGVIANPYFGRAMLTCGEFKK